MCVRADPLCVCTSVYVSTAFSVQLSWRLTPLAAHDLPPPPPHSLERPPLHLLTRQLDWLRGGAAVNGPSRCQSVCQQADMCWRAFSHNIEYVYWIFNKTKSLWPYHSTDGLWAKCKYQHSNIRTQCMPLLSSSYIYYIINSAHKAKLRLCHYFCWYLFIDHEEKLKGHSVITTHLNEFAKC